LDRQQVKVEPSNTYWNPLLSLLWIEALTLAINGFTMSDSFVVILLSIISEINNSFAYPEPL
jgi:hypothetical protein